MAPAHPERINDDVSSKIYRRIDPIAWKIFLSNRPCGAHLTAVRPSHDNGYLFKDAGSTTGMVPDHDKGGYCEKRDMF
jgi:hypothetical protein